MTSQNFSASMTKVPHIVLFAFFFSGPSSAAVDRKTVAWSFFATVGLGLLIELEEGATRTGYCRHRCDPRCVGALIAMVPLMLR
jgi:hypothetical protein